MGERAALLRQQPLAERGGGREHPGEHRREHDQDGDVEAVVLAAGHGRSKLAPPPFVQQESGEDRDQRDGLDGLGIH